MIHCTSRLNTPGTVAINQTSSYHALAAHMHCALRCYSLSDIMHVFPLPSIKNYGCVLGVHKPVHIPSTINRVLYFGTILLV